jgi:hypothetical protein
MTRPISDLNVTATRLQADMRQLVARQRLARGIAAEARHQMDPAEGPIDKAFQQMACDHPEACTCNPKDAR